MAWNSVTVEPWMALAGTTGCPLLEIVQDREAWTKTGSYRTGVLDVQVTCASGCTVYVEGADSESGPWSIIGQAVTSATEASICLHRDAQQGATDRLSPVLRWRLTNSGTAWTASFRIHLTLKD